MHQGNSALNYNSPDQIRADAIGEKGSVRKPSTKPGQPQTIHQKFISSCHFGLRPESCAPSDQGSRRFATAPCMIGSRVSEFHHEASRHRYCKFRILKMFSTIPRLVLTLVITSTVLLAAGGASAQGATGALSPSDFTISFEAYSNGQWVRMNSGQQQSFFNRARCLCHQDPSGEFKIVVQPAPGAGQKIQSQLEANLIGGGGVAYLFAGTQGYDCLSPNSFIGGFGLGAVCTNLLDPGNYPGMLFTTMANFGTVNFVESAPIPVAYLFNSLNNPTCGSNGTCDSAARCSTTATQTNIQFWAQTHSSIGPDFDPGPPAAVDLVGYVPLTPAHVTVEAGNQAFAVSWDWGGDQHRHRHDPRRCPAFLPTRHRHAGLSIRLVCPGLPNRRYPLPGHGDRADDRRSVFRSQPQLPVLGFASGLLDQPQDHRTAEWDSVWYWHRSRGQVRQHRRHLRRRL